MTYFSFEMGKERVDQYLARVADQADLKRTPAEAEEVFNTQWHHMAKRLKTEADLQARIEIEDAMIGLAVMRSMARRRKEADAARAYADRKSG